MKRLVGILMFILIIYVIYYDLSRGTLPIATETSINAQTDESPSHVEDNPISYFEKEVQRGETVLSIIESHLDAFLPVSIQQIVDDFEGLNNGIEANTIQIGETYKFPDYRELTE